MNLFLLYSEGKKLPESRYLFAMSCVRMNLLREAEDTLCPVNEPNIEVCTMLQNNVYVVKVHRYRLVLFLCRG